MEPNVEEWLIFALNCDVVPEFRLAHTMCDEAYSGPEQRRRVRYLPSKVSAVKPRIAQVKRADTALAA